MNESFSYLANGTSPVRELLKRKNEEYDKTFHSRRLKECERSFILFNEEMKQRKSEKENGRNIHIEEKSIQLKSVNTDRDKIKAISLDVDKNGNGVLEIDEFCLAMQNFGIEMEKSKAEKMFDSIDVGKIIFDEFYDYFVKEILGGGNTVSPKIFMEAGKKVNGRWNKFAAFKREGENGEIVMTGGTDIVEDVIPGKYNL